jgi:hypothetical protein
MVYKNNFGTSWQAFHSRDFSEFAWAVAEWLSGEVALVFQYLTWRNHVLGRVTHRWRLRVGRNSWPGLIQRALLSVCDAAIRFNGMNGSLDSYMHRMGSRSLSSAFCCNSFRKLAKFNGVLRLLFSASEIIRKPFNGWRLFNYHNYALFLGSTGR